MDWLIGILLLLAGAIIGYFVAKYVEQNKTKPASLDSEKVGKALMAQHAISHVQETRQLAHQFEQYTRALHQQIEAYEQTLSSDTDNLTEAQLNFFGEHASEYLRNKASKQVREKSSSDFQPLDFSSQSSGLFSGSADQKRVEEK